jgi:hypothetical protein
MGHLRQGLKLLAQALELAGLTATAVLQTLPAGIESRIALARAAAAHADSSDLSAPKKRRKISRPKVFHIVSVDQARHVAASNLGRNWV